MNSLTIQICPETAQFHAQIEELASQAFGPGRFTRTAFRLREGVPAEERLSFVALARPCGQVPALAGSVRLTPIAVEDRRALLLGPLVVSPDFKNQGIGRELMNRAISAAIAGEHALIVLVGDMAYYAKFGFRKVPQGQILLPGPADPERLLFLALKPDVADQFHGMARRIGSTKDEELSSRADHA